jgi:hypothetical protein
VGVVEGAELKLYNRGNAEKTQVKLARSEWLSEPSKNHMKELTLQTPRLVEASWECLREPSKKL